MRLVLFTSSYVPLFFIISLRLGTEQPLLISDIIFIPQLNFELVLSYISAVILGICGLLVFDLCQRMKDKSESSGTTQEAVDDFRSKDSLLSMYLLSYVFVFAGLDFSKPIDIAVFIVFFTMLAILQIRSDILYINPILGAFGYYAYEISSDGKTMLVISNGPIVNKLVQVRDSPGSEDVQPYTKIELVSLGGTAYLAP